MKQSVILWIATVIIIFLAGYTQRVQSPDYPINGTETLVTGEASFSFDRTADSKSNYKVWLADNCTDLKGILRWKGTDEKLWHFENMKPDSGTLYAYIPAQPPLSRVQYRVELTDSGKTYLFPVENNVTMEFLGHVPSQISMFYFITLFAGLLLAVRTGFEVFREPPRLRLYTLFTVISFFCFTLVFSTVKKGCELGIIGGTKIAPITDIFSTGPVLLFALWILAMIIIFNLKKTRIWAVVAAVGTIVIFLLGRF